MKLLMRSILRTSSDVGFSGTKSLSRGAEARAGTETCGARPDSGGSTTPAPIPVWLEEFAAALVNPFRIWGLGPAAAAPSNGNRIARMHSNISRIPPLPSARTDESRGPMIGMLPLAMAWIGRENERYLHDSRRKQLDRK